MSAFGGVADIDGQLASTPSSAYDPKRTSTGLKSRSAVVPKACSIAGRVTTYSARFRCRRRWRNAKRTRRRIWREAQRQWRGEARHLPKRARNFSPAWRTLRTRVAWAHDWVSDPTLTAAFQMLPGTSFIVNGQRPSVHKLQCTELWRAGGGPGVPHAGLYRDRSHQRGFCSRL